MIKFKTIAIFSLILFLIICAFINLALVLVITLNGLSVLWLIATIKIKQHRLSNILSLIGASLISLTLLREFLLEQKLISFPNPSVSVGTIIMAVGNLLRILQTRRKSNL